MTPLSLSGGSRLARLQRMMEMGMSRPWPEALTGEREIDASAMVEYFQPLLDWLEEQNRGRPVGY